MCMPNIPIKDQMQAIHALIDVDRGFCPSEKGESLYIRPFMFATEDSLGVKESSTYTFCVILSPSEAYYSNGFTNPIKLLISKYYHRAVSGGVGSAKAAGNYGASLRAARHAKSLGADQVLYMDSTNSYIEEAGSMNHFHIIDGGLIFPNFTDTILKSITAQSMIEINNKLGINVKQETITLDNFLEGLRTKDIIEAGGFGTAAGVTAVGAYILEDKSEIIVGDGNIGDVTRKMYDMLTGIQSGKITAPDGWLQKVERNIDF